MDPIITEFLKSANIIQLIAMAVMFWFFYTRLDSKIDKLDQKVDQRFDKVDQRFDKLEEKVTDIDRRICRLEGAFASKDCCMIKDDRQLKKAE